MKVRFAVLLAMTGILGSLELEAAPVLRKTTRAALEDKIRGGWAGQMIGVAYGAPTEFQHLGKLYEGELPWSPERVENALHQDDLYVEMIFAQVLERKGLEASTEQFGEAFRDTTCTLWHGNAAARRCLAQGLKAPQSGDPKYNIHANDIDFQIEADFIGLMCPGLPQLSNQYADRVGRVMARGDGLYGGMFVAAMYAEAFFEKDPRRIVEQALKSIPKRSGYARVIQDVLTWHGQNPGDWRRTWKLVDERWNRDDVCPEGALLPFNIDASLNGAYVVIGLLYGNGDFARTLEISTRCGMDSDCNPSSAAGILGVALGFEKIPERFKSGIARVLDQKFDYTQDSFRSVVQASLARAEKNILKAKGKIQGDECLVPAQTPKAPPLDVWRSGVPVARLDLDAWTWKGAWTNGVQKDEWKSWKVKESSITGSEAMITFRGTGIAISGTRNQEGGRADVYLDDKLVGTLDAWVPERTVDPDYWHITGLPSRKHTVRIVLRSDADPRSRGRKLFLEGAVVYEGR
jgi:hypothetical protein